jgi:molecular chaperone DnaK
MNPIVGIDLGTTNSVVSILKDKMPFTILVDNEKLLPSVVSLTDEGFIVGKVAKNMAILEPEHTVASIKRKMGQDVTLPVGDRQMRPEEISALILQKIRQTALEHLSLPTDSELRAVITVPAYFTEAQRAATRQAAELAHLKVERIINEPTAAALAFGMSQMEEATYVVYDFGGGTFDVSVIESNDGLVEVLATAGDNHLGGDDLDHLLAEHLWEQFCKTNQLGKITPGRKENARLLRIAEQVKIKLSGQKEVDVQESFFLKQEGVSYHLELKVRRTDFENLIREKVRQTVAHVRKAIEDAKLRLDDLDGILLVGGSSRIPLVSRQIAEELNVEPMLVDLPDEAVSHGATIQGAIIDKVDIDTVLIDITPHSLGIGVMDDRAYEGLFRLGYESSEAARKEGNLDLGVGVIIPKNTPIPVRRAERFGAVVPFQRGYKIEIVQGEGERLKSNKFIGEAILEVAKPVEDGEIEVVFHLDLDGLLHVTATETTTKEAVKAEFQSSRGIKLQRSKLEHNAVVAADTAANALVKRAETLLNNGELSEDDADDLRALTRRLIVEQQAGNPDDVAKTEAELLDLLYFLEEK